MFSDLRYAFRMLVKNPGFTLVAVLTLAMGIGLCTTIFSAVNPILFRPLPFGKPRDLVFVSASSRGYARLNLSYADFRDWRDQNHVFESFGIWNGWGPTIGDAGAGGELERVQSVRVSSDLLHTLRVNPILGRHFVQDDEKPGAGSVVIISHALWQRRWGADPNIIGRTLLADGEPITIVGVMPAGFGFPGNAELWAPLIVASPDTTRGRHSYSGVARLKPGVTIEEAHGDLSTIAARLSEAFPATNTDVRPILRPLRDELLGDGDASSAWMTLTAVGFVLVVACVNVANLFLARALGRHKEFAIRAALGASRWQIVRQLLIESMILGAFAGALGFAVSGAGLKVVLSLLADRPPSFVRFDVDWRVQVFTIGISLLTCLLFGLVPAWQASAISAAEGLKESGPGAGHGRRRGRVRDALVVVEVAMAVLLLAGAGLMIRSVVNLQNVPPGFNPQRMLVCEFTLRSRSYNSAETRSAFFVNLLDRVATLPGVQAAGAVSSVPMGGSNNGFSFSIDGRPAPPPGQEPGANVRVITPGYFSTMQIPILKGRDFSPADGENAPRVAIVEDNFARQFFPEEDPVGKRIKLGTGSWIEIVGVVGDVRHDGLDSNFPAGLYLPHRQEAWNAMSVVIRTTGPEPLGVLSSVRSTVREMDPALWFEPRTMDQIVQRSFRGKQFLSQLLGAFSLIALALAGVGIAAVVAYSVSQRTREIGIRMAIGAGRGQILRLVVAQGMIPVAIGLAAGLLASLALTRVLSSQLYGVGSFDPISLSISTILFIVVALLACIIPAGRAARIDPLTALRSE